MPNRPPVENDKWILKQFQDDEKLTFRMTIRLIAIPIDTKKPPCLATGRLFVCSLR